MLRSVIGKRGSLLVNKIVTILVNKKIVIHNKVYNINVDKTNFRQRSVLYTVKYAAIS